jgi:hypothetical protein
VAAFHLHRLLLGEQAGNERERGQSDSDQFVSHLRSPAVKYRLNNCAGRRIFYFNCGEVNSSLGGEQTQAENKSPE